MKCGLLVLARRSAEMQVLSGSKQEEGELNDALTRSLALATNGLAQSFNGSGIMNVVT
jgi:hypothetical protein